MWPRALHGDDRNGFKEFLQKSRRRCEAVSGHGSVVLSLIRLENDPLTLSELLGREPVAGFFSEAGNQISYHGDAPYQRAKMIIFLWAHMMWAHWYGYVLIVAHSTGALPMAFLADHESPCTRFVDTGLRVTSTGQLFTKRYRAAVFGMDSHPTHFVVHEDLDSAVAGIPFFLSTSLQPTTPLCPFTPQKDWVCACASKSANLVLKVSGGSHDLSNLAVNSVRQQARNRVSNDYFQTQLDSCFGARQHNVREMELWFNGQLAHGGLGGLGFTAANQIVWVQLIYPAVLLARNVTKATFPNPLHPSLPRVDLGEWLREKDLDDTLRSAWPLLSWRARPELLPLYQLAYPNRTAATFPLVSFAT